ncbi:MAG: GNAT family N-acetyltransferase [Candidatus Methylumidiphilus sp.]
MTGIAITAADLSQPAHRAALIQLLDEYAQDDMGGGGLSAYAKANLADALSARPGVHIILAFDRERPVGLLVSFEGFSTFACQPLLNIHDIVVSQTHRGLGIAKRLLAQAEAIALNLGCCKLTLEVLEGNAVAQAVYRSFGFAGYQLHPDAGRALFWQKTLTGIENSQ